MKIFKRKTNKDDVPKIVSDKIVYKLEKVWSNEEAKIVYSLYYGEQTTWSDGHKDMNPYYLSQVRFNNKGWIFEAYGDLAWAKRQAKHYNIRLPK